MRFRPSRSRLVLIGTSAGGLATVLAAAKMPGLAGWIGLDPVDRTGTGSEAAAQLDAPAIVLLGGASSCNLFGSGRDIARALPHLVRTAGVERRVALRLRGSDDQPLPRAVRRVVAQMQARIRDETVRAASNCWESPRRGTCRQRLRTPSETPAPDTCAENCADADARANGRTFFGLA